MEFIKIENTDQTDKPFKPEYYEDSDNCCCFYRR